MRRAFLALMMCGGLLASGCGDDDGDPGPEEDAGSQQDAGGQEDAGGAEDAGGPEDAGAQQDAGATPDDAGRDSAEPPVDAGQDTGAEPEDGGQDAQADAGEPPETAVGQIQGRVLELDGTAVTDARVEAGGVETRTDNRGIFTLESVPEGEVDVFVRDSAYSTGHARVSLAADQTASVMLRVMPLVTESLSDATAGGTVTGSDGVQVTVPGGVLTDSEGNAVSGAVDVNYVLVNTAESLAAAPGGMIAEDDADEPFQLESYGMVDISFSQNGERLNLDGTAELRFPIAASNPFSNGDRVGLYSFDEELGVWKQDGEGTIENGEFVADVDHFSWWNCDEPLSDKSCLSGTLLDQSDNPMANITISVTGVDYLTNLSAVTGDDGAFCVTVKRASTNALAAFGGGSAQSFFGLNTTAVSGTDATTCELGNCVQLGNLTTERLLSDCKTKTVGGTDHIYVMSSGNQAQDDAVESALEGLGQTVTVGVSYTQFQDVDLSDYDAVYLQANANWGSGDMPQPGQFQLVDWVNCGGGLVAAEWVLWKTASGSYSVLDHTFPAVPTTTYTSSASDIVYEQVDADPIMNAGLPTQFTFVADDYAGTETDMTPRPGSILFYDSVNLNAGVVGWSYNHGRVVNISTVAGPGQMANSDYARMMSNAFDWVRDLTR